jgi:hypothetical protein
MSAFFQTGSIKARRRRLSKLLWLNLRGFGRLSLVGIWKVFKQTFRWLRLTYDKLKWFKIFLEIIKLITEVIKNIHPLLFCGNNPSCLAATGRIINQMLNSNKYDTQIAKT